MWRAYAVPGNGVTITIAMRCPNKLSWTQAYTEALYVTALQHVGANF